MERRYATKEDFINNIGVIMNVWENYKYMYERTMMDMKGIISINKINELIIDAKKEANTKPEHEIAVEGFFDSYVATLTEVGHSGIVHKAMDSQLNNLLIESLV
jgi:hypothetical protein